MAEVQRVNPVSDEQKNSFESLRSYHTEVNKLLSRKGLFKKHGLPAIIAFSLYVVLTVVVGSTNEAARGFLGFLATISLLAFAIFAGKLVFKLTAPFVLPRNVREGIAQNFKGRLIEVAEQHAGPFGPRDSSKLYIDGVYYPDGLGSVKELPIPLKTITMVRFAGDTGTLTPTAPLHFLFSDKLVEMWKSDTPQVPEPEFDSAILKAEKSVIEKPVEM